MRCVAEAQRPEPRIMKPLFSPLEKLALVLALLVVAVLVPTASLVLSPGHPLHLSSYFVTLSGKILCFSHFRSCFSQNR